MLGQVMKLTKWHNFVVCDLWRLACGEILAKFQKLLANFAFRETGNFAHYEFMSFCYFMFSSNIILIEEKNYLHIHFLSDDPRVYEPACYEMLVGKVYYAK